MSNSRKHERVYLSKSNQANPSDIILVKAYLIGLGYEIVEHLGGDYKENLLGTCEYMVIVGWDEPDSEGGAFVGKGQHGQFQARVRRGYHYNYYYVGTNLAGRPKFKGVTHVGSGVDSTDWSRCYGTIHLKMDRAHSALTVISQAPYKEKKSKFNTVNEYPKTMMDSFSGKPIVKNKISLAAVRITRTF